MRRKGHYIRNLWALALILGVPMPYRDACEGLNLGWLRVPAAPKLNNPLEGPQDCSYCCLVERAAGCENRLDTLE